MEDIWKQTCSVLMIYVCVLCFVVEADDMMGARMTSLEEQVLILNNRLEKLETLPSTSGGHGSISTQDKCPDALCERVIGAVDVMRREIKNLKMNLSVESKHQLLLEKHINMLKKLNMRNLHNGFTHKLRMLNQSRDSPPDADTTDAGKPMANRGLTLTGTTESVVVQNTMMTSLVKKVQNLKVKLKRETRARVGLTEQVKRMRQILKLLLNENTRREQTALNKSACAILLDIGETEQHSLAPADAHSERSESKDLADTTGKAGNNTNRTCPIGRDATGDADDTNDKETAAADGGAQTLPRSDYVIIANETSTWKTRTNITEAAQPWKTRTNITEATQPWRMGTTTPSSSSAIFGKTYRDCWDLHVRGGYREDGVYEIMPAPGTVTVRVRCDMRSNGGGWTIFQRRFDGSLDFKNRTLSDYSNGFGDPSGEFWLGLEWVHLLTSGTRPHSLRVDLCDWEGRSRFAEYTQFSVDSSSKNYRLHIADYNGTAGNSLNYKYKNVLHKSHNGRMFQTIGKCARVYHGGWWYHDCHFANLNGGLYKRRTGTWQGIQWRLFNRASNLYSSEMKLRPTQIVNNIRDDLREYICPSK